MKFYPKIKHRAGGKMQNKLFRGCGTALVTPFSSDGRVDEAALQSFVEFQISQGIDFLVPCGTTGESAAMTLEEHLRVVDIVTRQAGGRVPVLAGAGGNNTAKIVELAREVSALGVDGLLSVTPYYNKPTQNGLYEHYKKIAEAVNTPVILYNVPSRTMCNMLPETVMRLSQIPNIAGLKEASGNIGQIGEIAAIMPEDFILLSGDDPNTLPLIAMGGSGVISVVSNQAPAMVRNLASLCLQGDFKEAMIWQKKLLPLFKANFIETNPIPVKAGLALMGKMEAHYRLPLTPMESGNLKRLENIMKQLGLIPD
jgi:4-hydroxy-tetrahydrodipicolinate synthase